MESLPNEVLGLICSFLIDRDIVSLCSINKDFYQKTYLFELKEFYNFDKIEYVYHKYRFVNLTVHYPEQMALIKKAKFIIYQGPSFSGSINAETVYLKEVHHPMTINASMVNIQQLYTNELILLNTVNFTYNGIFNGILPNSLTHFNVNDEISTIKMDELNNLESLTIGKNTKTTYFLDETQLIPKNLKSLIYTVFNEPIILPNLVSLDLGQFYDTEIKKGQLPDTLKFFRISQNYNYDMIDVLPNGLETFVMGLYFNKKITLPDIKNLYLGSSFKQPIIIPSSVKKLIIKTNNDNINVPYGVEELHLDAFIESVNHIPSSVKKLYLGIYAKFPQIPDSVEFLSMSNGLHNSNFDHSLLPKKLKTLELNYEAIKLLNYPLNIELEHLIIRYHNQYFSIYPTIPSCLKRLTIFSIYEVKFYNNCVPDFCLVNINGCQKYGRNIKYSGKINRSTPMKIIGYFLHLLTGSVQFLY